MRNNRENGEVVVEASIIVTLVVIIISIMFYIGMALYQQTAISTVANRTATNISQVYSNVLRDPFTGYLDLDNAYQPITYANMKTDAYVDAIKQKGMAFAQYRLRQSQIIPAVDRVVDVQVINKPNEMLKGQIVVTITDTYDVPLVSFFGLDGKLSYSATGRADCVDYLEYLPGVDAIADPDKSVVSLLPDADTCIVTFVRDRHTGGFHAAVPVLRGKTIITSNRYSHSAMPANPKNNGMRFTGWKTEDGRYFSATIQVDENMTVYGTWECEITFDPTGGTVTPTEKTVEYMKTATLPEPVRYGYAFEGWYSQRDGAGTKYESGLTPIPGNITLYAKWRCTHAEFTHTMTDAGNCRTKSTWIHECKTCDYSYADRGGYGPCEQGGYSATVAPSCTTPGWYIANCKHCGRLMSEGTLEPLGHKYAANGTDYDEPYERAATCYRTGLRGSCCSRCGAEKGEILEKTSHNLDAGTLIRESTCMEEGEKLYYCTNSGCTYCETRSIGLVDHDYNGRCGTRHWTRSEGVPDDCAYAEAGDRYYSFECIVCKWCGQMQGQKNRQLIDGSTIRTSKRVWCWDHIEKMGIVPSFEAMNEVEPKPGH